MTYPLPSGWQEFKLKDIGFFLRGSGISKKDLSDTGTPAIRYGDIYTKYNFVIKDISSYTNSKGTEIKKGDILFTGSGETAEEIGKSVAFIDDYKALAGGDIIIFRPNIDLNSIFLSYILNFGKCRKDISIMGQGHTVVHIYASSLEILKVILPPLDEQKRIAEVLSLCDDVIENLTELIEKKEQYKKGVMQRLLSGEVRFKGFKDEWTFKSLEKLCNIKKGEQKNKLDLVENGKYPVLSGGMDFSGYYNSYNREANTITISEGGNSCGYVNFIKTKFWASGHCYTLHDVNIDSLFLYQCLKYNENKIMKLRLGSGLPNIQLSYIREYTLKIPTSIEEQKKIGEFLSTIDNEIDNLKKQLELRKQQKKGLMQRLLTGEVRI